MGTATSKGWHGQRRSGVELREDARKLADWFIDRYGPQSPSGFDLNDLARYIVSAVDVGEWEAASVQARVDVPTSATQALVVSLIDPFYGLDGAS